MNKQNLDQLAAEVEKCLKAREKRKSQRMKVSGAGVKNLQRIFIAKK